jgi:glutamyl/glutaminyl-tRNA synthetase
MRMKLKLIAVIAVALVSMHVLAQSSPKLVEEMMVQTGSKDMFGNLDAMIASKIEEKKSTFTEPQQFDQFKTMMTSGLTSKNAEKYFTEYLEKYSKEDSVKMVITLYKDPFMQEFNRIEKESTSPEKQKEMMAFFQGMKDNPPAQGRIMKLVSLNQEMKTSEMIVKLIQNLAVSMMRGANNSLPTDKQVSEAEIKNNIATALPASFNQQMTNQLVGSMLFTYQNVQDEKLDRYIETWKTPTGKYCSNLILKALDYSFSKMGEITGSSFSVLGKDKK